MNNIAQTIKQQIGIDTWLAVSARNPQWFLNDDGDTVLRFRFGNRYGLPHFIEITYRPGRDLYDLKGYKIHRNRCRTVLDDYTDVYADSLGFLIRDINNEAVFA